MMMMIFKLLTRRIGIENDSFAASFSAMKADTTEQCSALVRQMPSCCRSHARASRQARQKKREKKKKN